MRLLVALALGTASPALAAGTACDNLRIIEPAATYGRLSTDQTACLETAFARASRTARVDISRVLITNAWARHDVAEWERLVARHLSQVDATDAELAYRYAHHLAKEPSRADEYLVASELALEHREAWTGGIYALRVDELLAQRARIGRERWESGGADAERWRKFTREAAHEWYVHVIQTLGHDDARAESFDLCVAAGGRVDYCERGAWN